MRTDQPLDILLCPQNLKKMELVTSGYRDILLGAVMVLLVLLIILYIQYYRDINTAYQRVFDGSNILMT